MIASLGVTHKTAQLAVLDSLTLRDPHSFYQILRSSPGVKGSIILQTCNRVEFYLDSKDNFLDNLLRYWALESKFKQAELRQIVQKRHGDEVIAHLVRLGSGLESMLVGEPQILGQLKTALTQAESEGAASQRLTEVFEKTIKAASRIRQHTGIGRGTVTIGSAAIKLSEDFLGDIRDCRVLLIGTGEVARLAMKALRARDIDKIMVAGRTQRRAESFCRAYGGTPISIKLFPSYLPASDLIITATTANHHLITKETMIGVSQSMPQSRVLILDLSTPRNVSPDVGELNGIVLKTIEDLHGIADAALAKRRELVKQAESLVKPKTEEISNLLRRKNADPVVSRIYQRAERIRAEVVERALSRLVLKPNEKKILETMSVSLVEKILDEPAVNLRKAAEKGDKQVLTAAGNIFGGNS